MVGWLISNSYRPYGRRNVDGDRDDGDDDDDDDDDDDVQ